MLIPGRQLFIISLPISIAAPTFRLGVQAMVQNAGLGKLKPNILVIGYKDDWITSPPEAVEEYSDVIHDAFDYNYGVAIFRLPKGTHLDEDESDSGGECSDFGDTDGELGGSNVSKNVSPDTVNIDVDVESDLESGIPASTPMILRDSKLKRVDNVAEIPSSIKKQPLSKRPKEHVMPPLTETRKGTQISVS